MTQRVTKLRELVTEHGGAHPLTLDDLELLVTDHDPGLYADVARRAVRNAIRSDLRADDGSGVPWALSIDNHGTYRQTSFMDVDEFRFAIRQYMRQSAQSRARAYALADRCKDIHGVWIDPAAEAAA